MILIHYIEYEMVLWHFIFRNENFTKSAKYLALFLEIQLFSLPANSRLWIRGGEKPVGVLFQIGSELSIYVQKLGSGAFDCKIVCQILLFRLKLRVHFHLKNEKIWN